MRFLAASDGDGDSARLGQDFHADDRDVVHRTQ